MREAIAADPQRPHGGREAHRGCAVSGLAGATGGLKKKDRITHKVEISRPADIDADVKKWLRMAYDRDAK